MARAMRREEIPLLEKQYEEDSAKKRIFWETQEEEKVCINQSVNQSISTLVCRIFMSRLIPVLTIPRDTQAARRDGQGWNYKRHSMQGNCFENSYLVISKELKPFTNEVNVLKSRKKQGIHTC